MANIEFGDVERRIVEFFTGDGQITIPQGTLRDGDVLRVVVCSTCGRRTSRMEAVLRHFNRARCAWCAGRLHDCPYFAGMPWRRWTPGESKLVVMGGEYFHPARRGIFKRAHPMPKLVWRYWARYRKRHQRKKVSPSNARFIRRQMIRQHFKHLRDIVSSPIMGTITGRLRREGEEFTGRTNG